MESQSKWYYLAIVVIVAAAIAGYFYWKSAPKEALPAPAKASQPAVSGTLPELNTETNVLKDVPEINPVDKANPFKDVYKNPFQ